MKRRLFFLILMTCLLLPIPTIASEKNSQQLSDIVKHEHYLIVDGYLFIDEKGDKDFSIEHKSMYTYYYDDIHYYEPEADWDIDRPDFDKDSYLAGLESMDYSTADVKNGKLAIANRRDIKKILTNQRSGLVDVVDKIEIDFDEQYHPTSFEFYKDGEIVYSYKIDYLTATEFYFRYYRRRLAEPAYYFYYTVRHFWFQSFLQGVCAAVFCGLSILFSVLVVFKLSLLIIQKVLKKNAVFSKSLRALLLVISGITVNIVLSITPYTILVFYLLSVIWGIVLLMKKFAKR